MVGYSLRSPGEKRLSASEPATRSQAGAAAVPGRYRRCAGGLVGVNPTATAGSPRPVRQTCELSLLTSKAPPGGLLPLSPGSPQLQAPEHSVAWAVGAEDDVSIRMLGVWRWPARQGIDDVREFRRGGRVLWAPSCDPGRMSGGGWEVRKESELWVRWMLV